MTTDQKLKLRCDSLIEKGESVLISYRPASSMGGTGAFNAALFGEWRSQSLTFLRSLTGESDYLRSFELGVTDYRTNRQGSVGQGIGVLRAVGEDLACGYLSDVRSLIAGEVFSDFLEMAEHLADAGHAHPSIALSGAVLEDGLRRVSQANDVQFSMKDGLKALLGGLAEAKLIRPLELTSLRALADLRNDVDHGNFDELKGLDPDRAKRVVDEVRSTLNKLL